MQATDKILVLDFGSQYTHLLARRVRELGVYSEIRQPTVSTKELREAKGIILSGGPASVYEKDAPAFNKEIFSLGVPVLGLCYGQQLMGHVLGGKVVPGKVREYGMAKVSIKEKKYLFFGLSGRESVWMSHGDKVEKLPPGFTTAGSTVDCLNAAIWSPEKKMFGLQFHPEVTHTVHGRKILANFLFRICRCKKNWRPESLAEQKVREIRLVTGKRKVFLLASGGVDSTVALALFHKAFGKERMFALHVDHGFMRKNESEKVRKAFEKIGVGQKELKVVDASKEFFSALNGVIDPEEKRKIIGKLFVDVANRETQKLAWNEDEWVLGQGTIYPDTIETKGSQNSAHIKTHHNQAEIIKELTKKGRVIEPLRDLYKDEVRALGEKIGLPKEIVWRHPFPGPGLAIRVLCSEGKETIPKQVQEKAMEVAKKHGFDAQVLPVKAVGVAGDFRTYRLVCALSGRLDWKKLEICSTALTNSVKEITRVVFCIEPKKLGEVKCFSAGLSRKRVSLLQEIDEHVMQEVEKDKKLYKEIWQFPVVLLPLEMNGKKEAVVLRPVSSAEAMTASFYPLPKKVLGKIVKKISKTRIGAVFFDVTHKPPATIEWE
ncbi:MAG: glutamine-hydrolyzing GMP synthase [archaeon]|nr:glutamine-hydrolyzing GMP synthase [archaeon]